MEDVLSWLGDKEKVASSDDYGKDFEHLVVNLYNRHSSVEAETRGGHGGGVMWLNKIIYHCGKTFTIQCGVKCKVNDCFVFSCNCLCFSESSFMF